MLNNLYRMMEYWWWRWSLITARPFKKSHSGRRALIVPCEPWTVIGSRGDEAMITAIVEAEQKRDPEVEIVFLAGRPTFDGIERFKNARVTLGWCGRNILLNVMRVIRAEAPDVVYALGADCMDGKYSVRVSQTLVGAAAYAAACGAEAHLTGFSFNETPVKTLRPAFRAAARYLAPYNLRDDVSLGRFERFSGAKARLVSDTAFGMSPRPTDVTEKWCAWCQNEQRQGRTVVGVNLNPMLFSKNAEERQKKIVDLAMELKPFLDQPVSFLFVPHDYRDGGDPSCLQIMYDELKADPHVSIVRDVLSAPDLKALIGGIDALFTCRMHLAIAALGQGKPISGFAYQGKFEGLLHHFDLPGDLIGDVGENGAMARIIRRLLDGCKELTRRVQEHLPRILDLAALNVSKD